MLNRTYPEQTCSVARALEVVGERWTLLILRDAVLGLQTFEEFQTSLGVATNVLSSRLKLLTAEGLLARVPDLDRPGRPKYTLTEKGTDLAPALIVLMKWGDVYYPAPGGPPRLTLHRGCGGSVNRDFVCERCGEHVHSGELDLPLGPGAPSALAPTA